MRTDILGVPVDAVTGEEALNMASKALEGDRGILVATPNPEMLVKAQQDGEFLKVLQGAGLALADGFGMLCASLALRRGLRGRVKGVEFMEELCGMAAKEGYTVYLLGGETPDVALRASEALVAKYPGLTVAGAESGGAVSVDGIGESEILERVQAASPDILFVAFGHGKQEKWIAHNLESLSSVRLAMGVGGSFDFIAGDVKRAPKLMRTLGLEWIWRLVQEPRRIGRIYRAVIVFPLIVIREMFSVPR